LRGKINRKLGQSFKR